MQNAIVKVAAIIGVVGSMSLAYVQGDQVHPVVQQHPDSQGLGKLRLAMMHPGVCQRLHPQSVAQLRLDIAQEQAQQTKLCRRPGADGFSGVERFAAAPEPSVRDYFAWDMAVRGLRLQSASQCTRPTGNDIAEVDTAVCSLAASRSTPWSDTGTATRVAANI